MIIIRYGKGNMFIWVFHRISGLLLILLLGLKFLTSFFLMTKGTKPDWALVLHTNPLTNTFLIVAGVYHAFYGLRTFIIDCGARKEKLLFWIFTGLGTAATAALLVIYYTRNY
jgi:succinate dehydrogenase/fumarate reductase cytochrome b subunit